MPQLYQIYFARFPEHVVSYIVVTLYFVSLRFWVNIMTNINEYVEVYP